MAPFISVILLDWILYAIAIFFMQRSGRFSTKMKNYLQQYIIVVITLSVLFVAAWIFGLLGTADLSSRNAYVASQYLFSILAAIHSILTFLMHSAIASQVKQFWLQLFYTITGRRQQYVPKQEESVPTELCVPGSGIKEVENITSGDPNEEIVEDVDIKVNLGKEDEEDLGKTSSL